MVPKNYMSGTLLSDAGKNTANCYLLILEDYHPPRRPDIDGVTNRIFVEKSCYDRQDELSGLFHRAGHAVQKRLARRKSLPRHRGVADFRGYERTGSGGNHRRKPDAVA